jgi:hypothetical protein
MSGVLKERREKEKKIEVPGTGVRDEEVAA